MAIPRFGAGAGQNVGGNRGIFGRASAIRSAASNTIRAIASRVGGGNAKATAISKAAAASFGRPAAKGAARAGGSSG